MMGKARLSVLAVTFTCLGNAQQVGESDLDDSIHTRNSASIAAIMDVEHRSRCMQHRRFPSPLFMDS